MGFLYPNLVTGTRGSDSVNALGANITCSKSVMSDGVAGEFTRFTVTENNNNGAPPWMFFFERPDISTLLALANGTACTATFLARATKTPSTNSFINVVETNAMNEIFSVVSRSTVPVGGGWSIVTCRLARNSTEKSNQALYMYIGVMPCSVGDTIDIAQPMVSLGTTPRAWAPDAGEVWPK